MKKKFWEAKYCNLSLRENGKVYGQKDREEFQAELEESFFKNRGCRVYILATRGINLDEKTEELLGKEDEKIKRKIFVVLNRTRKRMLIKLWFRNLITKVRNELLRFGAWLFFGRRL